MSLRQAGAVLTVLFSLLFLSSCSKGPEGPAKGSPEWLFEAAKSSFRTGEWDKAEESLEKIEDVAGNPFFARASVWHMVLETGRLLGHEDLVDAYDKGGPKSGKKMDFLRIKQNDLKEVRRHAVHLLEGYKHFEQVLQTLPAGSKLTLESPFPQGSAQQVADLERIYKGMVMSEEARALMHEAVLKRGMIRGYSAALTTIDDAPGAQKALESGIAPIAAPKFLLAMGQAMAKTAPLFDRKNLNEPDKGKLLWENAQACVKQVLDSKPEAALEKEAKKLQAEIEKAMKAKK